MAISRMFPGVEYVCNSFAMSLLFTMAAGCDDKPFVISCSNGDVQYNTVYKGSFGAPHFSGLDGGKFTTNLVIQHDGEYYEKYFFNDGNLPRINFRENTLLAGRIYDEMGVTIKNIKIENDCDKGITYAKIEAINGHENNTSFTDTYAVIIPKISEKTKVKFELKFVK